MFYMKQRNFYKWKKHFVEDRNDSATYLQFRTPSRNFK